MMKVRKILLSGCLVATLCSCGGSQNENLNLTLSKDALFDKVKGAGPVRLSAVRMEVLQSSAICLL